MTSTSGAPARTNSMDSLAEANRIVAWSSDSTNMAASRPSFEILSALAASLLPRSSWRSTFFR